MPWRTSSSSRTLTVFRSVTPQACSTWIARPENPHIGYWAVPFMKSTTRSPLTSSSMRCLMSLMSSCPQQESEGHIYTANCRRRAAAAAKAPPPRAVCGAPRLPAEVSERVVHPEPDQRLQAQVAHGIAEADAAEHAPELSGRARILGREAEFGAEPPVAAGAGARVADAGIRLRRARGVGAETRRHPEPHRACVAKVQQHAAGQAEPAGMAQAQVVEAVFAEYAPGQRRRAERPVGRQAAGQRQRLIELEPRLPVRAVQRTGRDHEAVAPGERGAGARGCGTCDEKSASHHFDLRSGRRHGLWAWAPGPDCDSYYARSRRLSPPKWVVSHHLLR